MDDLETLNRRARLRELIEQCFGCRLIDLLRHIEQRTGKMPNQGELSALQKDNGGKSFGDKKARALAEQIGLHRRWFDFPVGVNLEQGRWQSDLLLPADIQGVDQAAQFPDNKKGGKNMPKLASVSCLAPRTDLATIPQYDAGGSMGFGVTLPDQPGIIHNWQVNREWIEKNARSHTGVGNLRIVTGFGPSMQPMFNPGDPLLVDCGVRSVIADGIYFFRVGDEGFIKQLQKIPTSAGVKYIAKSKNADYDPFEIAEDMDFEVLGRVIRVWCGTDF